jgi:hypothetical protein
MGLMRKILITAVFATSLVLPVASTEARPGSWTSQANQVCTVYLAKAKKEFGSPVTPSQLYGFAVNAKTLESQELAELEKIPGRPAAGTRALAAMRVDIAEVGSAISAWKSGDRQRFVQILKQYLNDHRPKDAFAAAGANQCG